MLQSQPFGWFAIVVCTVFIAHKCRTDVQTLDLYNSVNTVMTHVKEIDQKLRPRIFLPHLFGELKYRVRVQQALGYICVVDSSSLHLIDNYICMMQAHDTIHQVVFITLDKKTEEYMGEKYPLLMRNFVDLEKQVEDLPLETFERTLIKDHLKRIVILQTVSLFTIRNFDMLVTNPYTFWTRNISEAFSRSSAPQDPLEKTVLFGQMGNSDKPFHGNLMSGETFIVMGQKELGRWFTQMINRLATTFSSLQGTMSYHCEDPRTQCSGLENEFFSTTDWFYGDRQKVPLIIEMDRAEYRTPRAIDTIGANFLTPSGKCDRTKVWEFGSQLSSVPEIQSTYPHDRSIIVGSAHARAKLQTTSHLRRRYAHRSLIAALRCTL